MPTALDPYKLLHGRYTSPALKRGDRAVCLYRDADVIVTGWSHGRISWPRCRRPDTRGGGSGLLVDEELARAIRLESSLAIQHWWRVTENTVWRWRQHFGVERFNEGSAQLRTALNVELGASQRGKKLPPDQVERRRRTALELGLQPLPQRPGGRPWTRQELKLLGKMPDAELAARIGRTRNAVRVMRGRLGLPDPLGPWHPEGGWTAEELQLLGTVPDGELAARFGRSEAAVRMKRHTLGIPVFMDRRLREHGGSSWRKKQ
jgi:hypothetical protein